MAKQPKKPEYTHCKVSESTNARAPWRVFYPQERDGQRKRVFKSFASESRAQDFAAGMDLEISNHGLRFGDIPPEVRRAFDSFRDKSIELRGLGAEVPSFEDLISASLAEIRARHFQETENQTTVAEGKAEFLSYKKGKAKARRLQDLTDRLARFAEDFGDRPLSSVTTAQVEAWLSALRSRRNLVRLAQPPLLAPLSRNHYRAALYALFAYASDPGRLYCQRNPLASLEPEQVEDSEPEAYTPEAAQRIMQAALDHKPELLPMLALGMFAGLRTSEALVFDLSKLDRKTKEFRAGGGGKTGARMVPFLDSCRAWIFSQPRREGLAYLKKKDDWYREAAELIALAKVRKINNGARDSFISYRCAVTRNPAQVADECGNSPNVIKKSYREIVTTAAAKKFFAVRPEAKAKNVTQIATGRKTA